MGMTRFRGSGSGSDEPVEPEGSGSNSCLRVRCFKKDAGRKELKNGLKGLNIPILVEFKTPDLLLSSAHGLEIKKKIYNIFEKKMKMKMFFGGQKIIVISPWSRNIKMGLNRA